MKIWLQRGIYISWFKKSSNNLSETYRPKSSKRVSCKLLEVIICRHSLNHPEYHDILTSFQYGFRSGLSSESQLCKTIHDLMTLLDNKKVPQVPLLKTAYPLWCLMAIHVDGSVPSFGIIFRE